MLGILPAVVRGDRRRFTGSEVSWILWGSYACNLRKDLLGICIHTSLNQAKVTLASCFDSAVLVVKVLHGLAYYTQCDVRV